MTCEAAVYRAPQHPPEPCGRPAIGERAGAHVCATHLRAKHAPIRCGPWTGWGIIEKSTLKPRQPCRERDAPTPTEETTLR